MAPSSENNPAIVPDEAGTGEMISGPPLSGEPGKAVGHAAGKLTLRHDLVETYVLSAGGLQAAGTGTGGLRPSQDPGPSDAASCINLH